MAAVIKAINAKIRSNKVLDYICSTRTLSLHYFRLFPLLLYAWSALHVYSKVLSVNSLQASLKKGGQLLSRNQPSFVLRND
jgi:hypothetical protein